MLNPQEFYRDINVIRRILEYCGVPAEETAKLQLENNLPQLKQSHHLQEMAKKMTAEYLSGWGEYFLHLKGKKASSRRPEQIGELLDAGVDLFRSVWNKQRLTFLWDVEYVSHKYPAEAYLNPENTFWKLEPVYRCFWDVFQEYGITPLTLVTGQGYHFVFEIDSYDRPYSHKDKKVSPLAKKMVEIGHLESTVEGKYHHLPEYTKSRRIMESDLGRAFDTMGKLSEFVVHKVMERLPNYKLSVPVGIGDLVPGNPMQEIINLDLSTFPSPLYIRVMRTAFSIHDKHKDPKKDIGARHIPVQITLPRYTPCNKNELSLDEIFRNRRHFQNSANYAAAITANIPECTSGADKLVEAYLKSELHKFHQDFDRTLQESPNDWWRTYDQLNLREVPPCVAKALEQPNPALLQPSQIQALVRVLTGKKWWHPKHVAGLIRSKYERNHGWSYNWNKHDANAHANVWVRMYAGLLAAGLDQRTDQNCISHQEKGLCPQPFCGYNLGDYR